MKKSKLGGALQETDESALWLELLREECGTASQLTQPLEFESNELLAIFTDIRYAMRLTREETKAISEEVRRVDAAAQIYLYGSRADDTARGGDIDLLVVSEQLDFRGILRLRTAILDRIGWQQLDLTVRKPNQLADPLAAVARQTGIPL